MLVAAALLAGAVAVMAADKPAAKPQTSCPVTGKAIDPKTSPHVDWEGQRIYLADKAAADVFRKDPEKVFCPDCRLRASLSRTSRRPAR